MEFLGITVSEKKQPVPYNVFCELKYLKELEHLNFAAVARFDDGYLLSDIANNCKKLKHSNAAEGLNFSTSDIQEITKFKNLEYLYLDAGRIDSQSLINIISNCLELKEFRVSFKNISENALKKLLNLRKLEAVNFCDCRNLTTNNVFIRMVNNCKKFVHLDISTCSNVTEATFIHIGKLQYLE